MAHFFIWKEAFNPFFNLVDAAEWPIGCKSELRKTELKISCRQVEWRRRAWVHVRVRERERERERVKVLSQRLSLYGVRSGQLWQRQKRAFFQNWETHFLVLHNGANLDERTPATFLLSEKKGASISWWHFWCHQVVRSSSNEHLIGSQIMREKWTLIIIFAWENWIFKKIIFIQKNIFSKKSLIEPFMLIQAWEIKTNFFFWREIKKKISNFLSLSFKTRLVDWYVW